jgi:glycosyltransferase involved in cell wall biosynthesis
MNPVLLTVSGTIQPDIEAKIAAGQRPVADYIAMAKRFNADLIDFARARQTAGWFGRLLEKILGPAMMLVWVCFRLRKQYRLIFTDGEQIGIPLAFLLKFLNFGPRPKHFMIGHILSVDKKMFFFDWFGVQSRIDRFFVYSTYQKTFIESRWKVPAERVIVTPFMVDHQFFKPELARSGNPLGLKDGRPIICSVGLEFRDYATLIQAVKGLDVKVVIAAASPWSKRQDKTQQMQIPENIIVKKFTQFDLRDLYAASEFMVMPLYPVKFQAGVTAILEAMAMEKAVICSRTPGQTDVIVEGKNGLYVPPEDVDALRQAISGLLKEPQRAQCYGEAGRQTVLESMSLEKYVERLVKYVEMDI